jgi:hypothetical protein
MEFEDPDDFYSDLFYGTQTKSINNGHEPSSDVSSQDNNMIREVGEEINSSHITSQISSSSSLPYFLFTHSSKLNLAPSLPSLRFFPPSYHNWKKFTKRQRKLKRFSKETSLVSSKLLRLKSTDTKPC